MKVNITLQSQGPYIIRFNYTQYGMNCPDFIGNANINHISSDMFRFVCYFVLMSSAAAVALRSGSPTKTFSCDRVRAVPNSIRTSMRLSNYYQKYTEAYGIPVLSSQNVPDDALSRAWCENRTFSLTFFLRKVIVTFLKQGKIHYRKCYLVSHSKS